MTDEPEASSQTPPAKTSWLRTLPRDALGLAFLSVAAFLCAGIAFVFLTSAGGLWPMPQVSTTLHLPVIDNPKTAVSVGSVSALVAGLLVIAAWGWRRRVLRYRHLLRSLEIDPDGRVITAPRGNVVYSNAALDVMLGEANAARFKALGNLADLGAEAERLSALLALATAGSSGHTEIFLGTPGDVRRRLKVSAYPLHSWRGHVLWCIEDITARHQMEQALREERGKLVDFLEKAAMGFYAVDAQGRFVYANHAFADWLGLTPAELIQPERRLGNVISGSADPERPYMPFPPGHTGDRGEVTLKRKDGSEFPVEIIQTVSGDAGEGTFVTRSVVRDLTTERELEEIRHQSEQRFRKLFEDSPTGIAILDLDGTVIDCNRAFRALAPPGADPMGVKVETLIAQDDRTALGARLKDAVTAGRTDETPLDLRFAGEDGKSASVYLTRLEDADGVISAPILHFFDTTVHRRLEVQFAQSQKMQAVGQLAGGIAHDFNNLLTVMIGFCDLILQRHRPGEQTFADIMQIKQNSNRAANLVRQLLAFSRQQTLQPKVLDVTDVLAELSNLLRRLIGVNITLSMVHGRDLGLVRVDQVQLEQVIINLAVNARDAMKDVGGTLTITTTNEVVERPMRRGTDVMPPGEYVHIDVTDTGHGISPEIVERIFEPFYSTKEVGSGTGLGLSTVYGIVTQTGGFVHVASVPDEGTTFSIYLPRWEEVEGEGEVAEAAARPAANGDLTGEGTVLLVEDEDPVRLFGARALRNKGYTVLEAKNGNSALQVMQETAEPIDLVISDVVMPEMDGPGLIREVRERYPGMKVIFISGYAEDDFRENLERSSGIHFLAKPFSLEQLASKVKQVMAE